MKKVIKKIVNTMKYFEGLFYAIMVCFLMIFAWIGFAEVFL